MNRRKQKAKKDENIVADSADGGQDQPSMISNGFKKRAVKKISQPSAIVPQQTGTVDQAPMAEGVTPANGTAQATTRGRPRKRIPSPPPKLNPVSASATTTTTAAQPATALLFRQLMQSKYGGAAPAASGVAMLNAAGFNPATLLASRLPANGVVPRIEDVKVALEKVFPNLDLALWNELFHDATNIPGFDPKNMSEEQLANWMLDNMDKIPLKNRQELDQQEEQLSDNDDGGDEGERNNHEASPKRKRMKMKCPPDDSDINFDDFENLDSLSSDESISAEEHQREEQIAGLLRQVIALMSAELEDHCILALPSESWELTEHFLATKFFTLRLRCLRQIIATCTGKMVPALLCALCAESGHFGPFQELLDCYGHKAISAEREHFLDDFAVDDHGDTGKWEKTIYSSMRANYEEETLALGLPIVEQEYARYEAVLATLKEKYPLAWVSNAQNGSRQRDQLHIASQASEWLPNGGFASGSGGGGNASNNAAAPSAGSARMAKKYLMMECLYCRNICEVDKLTSCKPSFPYDPNVPTTSTATFTSHSSIRALGAAVESHSYCVDCMTNVIGLLLKYKSTSLEEVWAGDCINCPVHDCAGRLNTREWFGHMFTSINEPGGGSLANANRKDLYALLCNSSSESPSKVGKKVEHPSPSTAALSKLEPSITVELHDDRLFYFSLPLDRITVGALKERIWRMVPPDSPDYKELRPQLQRLFFAGIELDNNECKLEDYGMVGGVDGESIRVKLMQKFEGVLQTFTLEETHFHPAWNVDFRRIKSDTRPRERGQRPYTRPLGCMRYAIRVLGRYDNDDWLGMKGVSGAAGEWPVAYHGTPALNVHDILLQGFDVEKGKRFAFGKGIYCTPNPLVALGYGQHYSFENKNYKLIIQCRVDPQVLQLHGEYWTVPDGRHIRPYGICTYDA